MQLPLIHLNGTSKEHLIGDAMDAYAKIDEAMDKLKRCCPNGRDYYPLGMETLRLAEREHLARMKKLQDVMDELQEWMIAVQDGGHKS